MTSNFNQSLSSEHDRPTSSWVPNFYSAISAIFKRGQNVRRDQRLGNFETQTLESRMMLSGISVSVKLNGQTTDLPTGSLVTPGDSLAWTYEVSNTGSTALADISLLDDNGSGFESGEFGLQEFIAAPNRVDVAHDALRDLVYISTDEGQVLRYSLTTKTFLTPFEIEGSLAAIEISPDEKWLAVGNFNYGLDNFSVVNLETHEIREVALTPTSRNAPYSLGFLNDTQLAVTNGLSPAVRIFDVVTGEEEVSTSVTSNSLRMLDVSADGTTVGFVTGGDVGVYDVESDTSQTIRNPWILFEVGISRDGSQIAIPTYGGTYLYDTETLTELEKIGIHADHGPIGVAYSPVRDVVYFAWASRGSRPGVVDAWDTNTLTRISTIDSSESFDWTGNASFQNGRLKTSADGRWLFSTTEGGVSAYGSDDFSPEYLSGDENEDGLLDPDETWIFSNDHVSADVHIAGTGQFEKTVQATGTDTASNEKLTATDEAAYFGITSGLSITSTINGQPADSLPGLGIGTGEDLTWTYEVQNTGNFAVSEVNVMADSATPEAADDDVIATLLSGDTNEDGLLDPDETWSFEVVAEAVEGQRSVTATATGRSALAEPIEAFDQTFYIAVTSSIDVSFSVAGTESAVPEVSVGDDVVWRYEVSNLGTVPLDNIRLVNDRGNGFSQLPTDARHFIAADDRMDIVFDDLRRRLYISTSSGRVLRYQLDTQTFLEPFEFDGVLVGIDLSPNMNTLVVANGTPLEQQSLVHVIDLETETSEEILFDNASLESGTRSVAFINDTTILTTSGFAGSGWIPLRQIDLESGEITSLASVRQNTMLASSADLSVVAYAEANTSSGAFGRYQVSDGTFQEAGTGGFGWEVGVSRNGDQFAVPNYSGTVVYDHDFNELARIGTPASKVPIGLVYSPISDVVYFAWFDRERLHPSIDAWDTKTLTSIGAIDETSQFGWVGNSAYDEGRLKISRDDMWLFSTVEDGIMAYGKDDILATLISGDTNNDGLLDPNETWIFESQETANFGTQQRAANVTAIDTIGRTIHGTAEAVFQGIVQTTDFGDAPDPLYPSRYESDGARHKISNDLRLGVLIDEEPNAQQDDVVGLNDEDGVSYDGELIASSDELFSIESSGAGYLNAWIDFNADGDWDDAGEQIALDIPVQQGTNDLTVSVPATAIPGNTFARFRLNSDGGLASTGPATDGEVEDHQVSIGLAVPELQMPASTESQNPTIEWTSVAGASSYDVWINNQTTGVTQYVRTTVDGNSSLTSAEPFQIGIYNVWVRAISDTGVSSRWSAGHTFRKTAVPELSGVPAATFKTTPELSWEPISGADSYEIFISHPTGSTSDVPNRIAGLTTTRYQPETPFSPGRHTVWVRASVDGGFVTAWSAPSVMQIGGRTTLRYEDSTAQQPASIVWDAVDEADSYDLWVNQVGGQSQIIRASELTEARYVPDFGLPEGTYQAWVRAETAAGTTAPWSPVTTFDIESDFSFVFGDGPTFSRNPTWVWEPIPNTSTYDLMLEGEQLDSPLIYRDINDVRFTVAEMLETGTYKVSVRRVFADGTVDSWQHTSATTVIGGRTQIETAIVASDGTLTVNWKPVEEAILYEVWIGQVGSNAASVRATQHDGSSSYTHTTTLPEGEYQVWIRAVGYEGQFGTWSFPQTFSTVGEHRVLTGVGSTFDRTPTWTWNPLPEAVSYDIFVESLAAPEPTAYVLVTGIQETSSTADSDMPDGPYRVWHRGVREDGSRGAWQTPANLNVGGRPVVPQFLLTESGNLTVAWDPVTEATSYELWIGDTETSFRLHSGSGIAETTFDQSLTSVPANGTYRAWVRAISSDGEKSAWGRSTEVVISTTLP